MRARLAGIAVAVVVAAVVVGGLVWWGSQPSSDLERAIRLAPAEAERVTWTDWGGIREELGSDVGPGSPTGDLVDLLDEGYEADLTSASALLSSATALHEEFGFSPASLEWELFSQSAEGAVVIMGLPEATDLDRLGDGFEALGYTRPSEDDGVWLGGAALLPGIAPRLTPELQYLAIDTDEGLVLASDTQGYLERVTAADDDGPAALVDVVEASGDPLSAVVYDSAYVCAQLAMSAADEADRAEAETLVEAAGEVNPITGYAMSAQSGGGIRVVMSFENDDQARANADSRSVLARGPAPGQGGGFADRFTVDEVSAEGSLVTMELDPVEGGYVLSDLSSGPVLFATC